MNSLPPLSTKLFQVLPSMDLHNQSSTENKFIPRPNTHDLFMSKQKKIAERTVSEIGSRYVLDDSPNGNRFTIIRKEIDEAYSATSTNYLENDCIRKNLSKEHKPLRYEVDGDTFKRLQVAKDIIWAVKQAMPRGAANQALDNINSEGTNRYAFQQVEKYNRSSSQSATLKAGVCTDYAQLAHHFAHHILQREGLTDQVHIFEYQSNMSPHDFVVIGNDPETMIVADPWPDLPAPFLYKHLKLDYKEYSDPTGKGMLKSATEYPKATKPENLNSIPKIETKTHRKPVNDLTTQGIRASESHYPNLLAQQCNNHSNNGRYQPVITSIANPATIYVNSATQQEIRADSVPTLYLQRSVDAIQNWKPAVTAQYWTNMNGSKIQHEFALK